MASSELSKEPKKPFLAAAGFATALALGVAAKYLPVRVPVVDAGIATLLLCHVLASAMLLTSAARRTWPLRLASGISALLGSALVAAMVASAVHLAGIHGPVGRGGVVLFVFVLLLAVPYLVALPLAQLAATRPKE